MSGALSTGTPEESRGSFVRAKYGIGLFIENMKQPPIRFRRSGAVFCAPEGIRTPNLLIRSQMLYPLSYGRIAFFSCHPANRVWRRREDLNLRSP